MRDCNAGPDDSGYKFVSSSDFQLWDGTYSCNWLMTWRHCMENGDQMRQAGNSKLYCLLQLGTYYHV